MKPKIPLLLMAVAVVAAFGFGYLLGGGSPRAQVSAQATTAASTLSPAAGERTRAPFADSDTPAERRAHSLSALIAATNEPSYMLRKQKISAAIQDIAAEDIASALDAARRLKNGTMLTIVPMLITRWAEFDPKAAADFALADKGGQGWEYGFAINTVASAWGKKDAAGAKAWALALTDAAKRRWAVAGVATSLTETDPMRAIAWLQQLPAAQRGGEAYDEVFNHWATRDPSTAAHQAMTLPPGDTRARAIRAVADRWADSDPRAALAWVTSLQEPGVCTIAMGDIFMSWAMAEPDAALDAARQLPRADQRRNALNYIVETVARTDIPRAGDHRRDSRRAAAKRTDGTTRAQTQSQ